MKYFLDTNICIYFLKGEYPSIQAELEQKKPSDIKIPSVVKAELLYGVEKSQKVAENRQKVAGFLSPFEILLWETPSVRPMPGFGFNWSGKEHPLARTT